jgi:flavodoxin
MKALVVYESMFGNTAAIGDAIATSLRARGLDVESGLVSRIGPERTAGIDVLVVGGPTHVHGMSSPRSRQAAVADGKNTFAEATVEPGLKEWLKQVYVGEGRLAAAFDTRIDKPVVLTGSAAKGIGRRLKGRGYRLVTDPECFFVSAENTLVEGELEHAATWADQVADKVTAEA